MAQIAIKVMSCFMNVLRGCCLVSDLDFPKLAEAVVLFVDLSKESASTIRRMPGSSTRMSHNYVRYCTTFVLADRGGPGKNEFVRAM